MGSGVVHLTACCSGARRMLSIRVAALSALLNNMSAFHGSAFLAAGHASVRFANRKCDIHTFFRCQENAFSQESREGYKRENYLHYKIFILVVDGILTKSISYTAELIF